MYIIYIYISIYKSKVYIYTYIYTYIYIYITKIDAGVTEACNKKYFFTNFVDGVKCCGK